MSFGSRRSGGFPVRMTKGGGVSVVVVVVVVATTPRLKETRKTGHFYFLYPNPVIDFSFSMLHAD